MDTNTKYCTVYNMRIALELKNRGHIVAEMLPNPKKPEFICWVFIVDKTFNRDLRELKGGVRIGK